MTVNRETVREERNRLYLLNEPIEKKFPRIKREFFEKLRKIQEWFDPSFA